MLIDVTPGHGKFDGNAILTLHFGTLFLSGLIPDAGPAAPARVRGARADAAARVAAVRKRRRFGSSTCERRAIRSAFEVPCRIAPAARL
jgi:hypothetical protein